MAYFVTLHVIVDRSNDTMACFSKEKAKTGTKVVLGPIEARPTVVLNYYLHLNETIVPLKWYNSVASLSDILNGIRNSVILC